MELPLKEWFFFLILEIYKKPRDTKNQEISIIVFWVFVEKYNKKFHVVYLDLNDHTEFSLQLKLNK